MEIGGEDSNPAYSESSQDGSMSQMSGMHLTMDTNEASNSNLPSNREASAVDGTSQSSANGATGNNNTNKPNLSALLENSTDAQFPE